LWNQLDPAARGFTFKSPEQMTQLYQSFRKPMGAVIKREPFGFGSAESPSGFPAGLYRVLGYRTKYAALPSCRQESVTLRATQDRQWRVFVNNISPTGIDC
jgi:hypothetical protein